MFNQLESRALDQWFQRFNTALRRLPAAERADLHQEVRQHLDSLVAANEELGSSPDEAWELALAQFGDPARIGRRISWEPSGWRLALSQVVSDKMTPGALPLTDPALVRAVVALIKANAARWR